MTSSSPVEWTIFSPSETEAITGVPLGQQRKLKHRGFLSAKAADFLGYNRSGYTVFDVAELLFFQMAGEKVGMGPSSLAEISKEVANNIAAHAICRSLSFDKIDPMYWGPILPHLGPSEYNFYAFFDKKTGNLFRDLDHFGEAVRSLGPISPLFVLIDLQSSGNLIRRLAGRSVVNLAVTSGEPEGPYFAPLTPVNE